MDRKEELRTELVRKSIHLLVALAPLFAWFNRSLTLILLGTGTFMYAILEGLRQRGVRFPIISDITDAASRQRDKGHFVWGPVTLGVGAFLSILLFPSRTAAIAVLALAAGDSLSSLTGKFVGKIRLPFLFGKSLEGSAACFLAVFASALLVSRNPGIALAAAAAATITEALPLRNWDNIVIPLVTGFTVLFVQPLLQP